ncbi:DEAD/DEAH box helicase [Acidovorax sp.]|jgi:superfamily II DNA/RNA helicase|uniref:DEAD/DEAH box helicase n=1 Tax=Acidovorax sp. TaxID=1872122 RepID=UPI0025C06B72|nr:DEAD/DEAH box helicase [Acidovorax sp.]
MTSSFSNLSLAEPLARAVAEMGYESMTPIQEQAIPVVLTGQDVMGAAQTGTGKTAAFSLPLLQRLLKHESSSTSPARHPVRALVLLPTRELADQVAQQIALYAKYTKLRSTVVFGGMDMKPQTIELKKGVEVLVATPGRLLDHIEAKNAVLNQVEYVVLDEADRMLDIGFLPDLQRILSYLPKQRTTLLFSATFSPEIKRLAGSYLQNPITIEVARPNETASTVEQRFYSANDDDKRRAIHQVLRTRGIKQAFIFVNSKLGCARLARSLEREGLKTTALHGDKSQDERLKALDAFKQGEVDLLVCTDVAARGLDIKDVPAVFNFDVPFNAEDYVHRIGRTGRAGASGLAVTLVSGSDARLVADIEKLLKTKLDIEALEYDEDRPNIQQQGRINDGRRAWREGGASAEPRNDAARRDAAPRERERREPREPREYRGFRPAVASRDPFFEKPYESSTADVAPAWEAAAKSPARSGVSANIKPKRKVAALFKALQPETAVAAQPQPQQQPETSDQ